MVYPLLGGLAVFVSIVSLYVWATGGRTAGPEARLKQLSTPPRPGAIDSPFSDRVLVPVLDTFTRLVVQLLPQKFVTRIGRQLVAAGRPMSTQAFFTTLVVTSTLVPFAMLSLVLLSNDGSLSLLGGGLVLVAVALGIFGPLIWLRRRARARKTVIWKSLADAFDLVTVSVEAGLGLDAALRQVSQKLRGPLGDEIGQMLREVGMGRPRREALEDLAERTDVPEVTTFVNAVIQAEQLGTSLGRVLRAQAMTLRVRRRQRAEEMARKAPVKLVFPLVLCIMPSFFIVTIGPVFVRLVNYLSE
jgi:tight adherence protein C